MSGYRSSENRALTADERELCEWLIDHGTPQARRYASQLEHATVVGRCTCGCPSIDIAVDGIDTVGPSEIIGDAVGNSPEGFPVGVVLHCRQGQLSELEVYPFVDPKCQFGLPKPEGLTSILDDSQ